MSDPHATKAKFIDELTTSILASALKRRKGDGSRSYDMRSIGYRLKRHYDELYHTPSVSQAEVYSRLYAICDVIKRNDWSAFSSLLDMPGLGLSVALNLPERDAEAVREICNSIRKTSGHLSS